MSLSKDEARDILKHHGLRSTGPRIAVLRVLSDAKSALSYTDVVERLGDTDWDPATVYRNLIKLREAEITTVISRAEGISRYALKRGGADEHQHPHFVCDNCSQISCLPVEVASFMSIDAQWSDSISKADVQLRGECPECLDSKLA